MAAEKCEFTFFRQNMQKFMAGRKCGRTFFQQTMQKIVYAGNIYAVRILRKIGNLAVRQCGKNPLLFVQWRMYEMLALEWMLILRRSFRTTMLVVEEMYGKAINLATFHFVNDKVESQLQSVLYVSRVDFSY